MASTVRSPSHRFLAGDAGRPRRARSTVALLCATALLLGIVTLNPAEAVTVVYSSDFESGAGPEWSPALTETTPGTVSHPADRFLGRLGNGSATFSLTGLPSHSEVTVSFSLYVVRSWDGNSDEWGPDTWDMSVVAGPTLLHTTFSNLDTGPCVGHGFDQAYPDNYPGGIHPPLTGADEIDTLGYPALCEANDAVYHLEFTFAHTDGSFQLVFTGSHLQELNDESWGIDDFSVSLDDTALSTTTTVCKPGHGYGDKNHCHSGPRGGRT